MASLKTRDNSPYYYMQFKDPPGKWKTKKTNYLVGVPPYDKEARAHCAYQSAHEKAAKGVTRHKNGMNGFHPSFAPIASMK
jgi:hypothetical protein